MNTDMVPARRVESREDLREPGDFCWERFADGSLSTLVAILPGETVPQGINVNPRMPFGRWKVSGTEDRPTLEPSLHLPGAWHGWLRDGEFVSC